MRSTTFCACLIQFKVLDRAHFYKSRLCELYPEVDNKCDKCHDLKGFWAGYFTIMSSVLGVNLQLCPVIAIFGISDPSLVLNPTQKDIIAFTSLLARRSFLLYWKSAKYPSISQWLKDNMFLRYCPIECVPVIVVPFYIA